MNMVLYMHIKCLTITCSNEVLSFFLLLYPYTFIYFYYNIMKIRNLIKDYFDVLFSIIQYIHPIILSVY